MTKQELHNRFDFLGDVLRYSRDRGYLNTGQRTCLHQERSAIMQAREMMISQELEFIELSYTIPEYIEHIVKRVQRDFHL